MTKSEDDLEILMIKERIKYLESEQRRIHSSIAKLNNDLRWLTFEKQDLLTKLSSNTQD